MISSYSSIETGIRGVAAPYDVEVSDNKIN